MPLCHFHSVSEAPCPPAGAMIRRRKSVLFKTIHCRTLNLLASSFATLSHASRTPSKDHSVPLISTLKMLLYSSQSQPQKRKISEVHHFGGAVCVRTTLYLFLKFFGRRLSLPLGSVFLPPLLSRHPSQTSSLSIFRSTSTPNILCINWSFPSILQSLPRCAFFSTTSFQCQFFNGASPLPSNFRCNTADTDWPCVAPHHPRPLSKQTARI